MISISLKPSADFEETLRSHLMQRGEEVMKEALRMGVNEHNIRIDEWNRKPDIYSNSASSRYSISGTVNVKDTSESWWWLVNDGGSTMPKGGGMLVAVNAPMMQLASYSPKTDGGSGERSNIWYRRAVSGPREVRARKMLEEVEELVTPDIIAMAQRSF